MCVNMCVGGVGDGGGGEEGRLGDRGGEKGCMCHVYKWKSGSNLGCLSSPFPLFVHFVYCCLDEAILLSLLSFPS